MIIWQERAACRGNHHLYYGPPHEQSPQRQTREQYALRICATCPVLAECRDAGRQEEHGIWGGQTEQERGYKPHRHHHVTCGTDAGYKRHLRNGTDTCRACRDAHNTAWQNTVDNDREHYLARRRAAARQRNEGAA